MSFFRDGMFEANSLRATVNEELKPVDNICSKRSLTSACISFFTAYPNKVIQMKTDGFNPVARFLDELS